MLLYWAARIVDGEDPLYIIRRLVAIASEDIGNADQALEIAINAQTRRVRRSGRFISDGSCDSVLRLLAPKVMPCIVRGMLH